MIIISNTDNNCNIILIKYIITIILNITYNNITYNKYYS